MPGKKARDFVQKQRAPYLSSAALADNLPRMHKFQAEEDFVRSMMVLQPQLLHERDVVKLKHLGLTPRQLVVLGFSKRAMDAAGIKTAQLEPRWEPPATDNPQTAEAYRGKVHGKSIAGYAAPRNHTRDCYIIADLPQFRTKIIPLRGRYRVRFRMDKDLKDTSRLIAGIVDQDSFMSGR